MNNPYRIAATPAPEPKLRDDGGFLGVTLRQSGMLALAAALLGATPVALEACSPAQGAIIDSQVPSDVLADINCVTSELLQGQITDPLAIIAECGPLLVSQIVTLIDSLLATPAADAGAPATTITVRLAPNRVVRVPHVVLTETQRTRLVTLRAAALAQVDAGAK